MLLKLVYGTSGVLYIEVQSGRSEGAYSRLAPIRSNSGSSTKPTGTNSAHPSMPPPNDTLSSTISENTTRLCTSTSGVSPSAEPSAMPAPTCPGVPSECSVLMID